MSTFASIEKKTGSNASMIMVAQSDLSCMIGPTQWKWNDGYQKLAEMCQGSKLSDDEVSAQNMEAREGGSSPKNATIICINTTRKVTYRGVFATTRTMGYAPVMGQARQVTSSLVNTISNQKMRGGIAG